ncbi:hypothetical protein [Bacillus alkalicellulosilyticus]|uniref:hypothetical protein n=1 Tax=Alkalihalobacterium alkalicellulosilyticum TaxID=1912214 RepID=UPI000997C1C7|nr:hypothetical protein [Bacillus alkalicellulosilyticus]
MLFKEEGINNFITELKEDKMNVERINFTYNNQNQSYTLITCDGVPGIAQEADYYENLGENLIYSDMSWLQPICKAFKCKIQANVKVLADGSLDHEHITVEANLMVPKNVGPNIHGFLYPRFRTFVKFYPLVKEIKFSLTSKDFNSQICNIFFTLEFDAKKVNAILRDQGNVNQGVLEQWLNRAERCLLLTRDKAAHGDLKRSVHSFEVINGKANAKSVSVNCHFKNNDTMDDSQ